MKPKSLQIRIFLYMILLLVITFLVVTSVTIIQYKKQADIYNKERLLYKKNQLVGQVKYVLSKTTYPIESQYIPLIFKKDIFRIANLENTHFSLYDINGTYLIGSEAFIEENPTEQCLDDSILNTLETSVERILIQPQPNSQKLFSYIEDNQFKPILILYIADFENDTFLNTSLRKNINNLGLIYGICLILAFILAFIISKYITKNLKTIERTLNSTQLLKQNKKIIIKQASPEIKSIVSAYNNMLEELETSKQFLAESQKQLAWSQMAKQIAHEIKNPLTPMRLSIQNFERKFSTQTPDIEQKTKSFCHSLIQQIDTLTDIASAFSAFSSLPDKKLEKINVNQLISSVLQIFDNDIIFVEKAQIEAIFDKNHLNRIVTNLVKNATQATEDRKNPKIEVILQQIDDNFSLMVKDNGVGIAEDLQHRIFEPKFTTKNSGSGLGLAIIKNIVNSYSGRISFTSKENIGSTFEVILPKTSQI